MSGFGTSFSLVILDRYPPLFSVCFFRPAQTDVSPIFTPLLLFYHECVDERWQTER
jgi:hypothetical protein